MTEREFSALATKRPQEPRQGVQRYLAHRGPVSEVKTRMSSRARRPQPRATHLRLLEFPERPTNPKENHAHTRLKLWPRSRLRLMRVDKLGARHTVRLLDRGWPYSLEPFAAWVSA